MQQGCVRGSNKNKDNQIFATEILKFKRRFILGRVFFLRKFKILILFKTDKGNKYKLTLY